MSTELGDAGGIVEDRRAKARTEEETVVATALVDLCKCAKIICSRQGDLLYTVLKNLNKNEYDVEALSAEVISLMRKVNKRVRKYG